MSIENVGYNINSAIMYGIGFWGGSGDAMKGLSSGAFLLVIFTVTDLILAGINSSVK